MKLNSGKAWMMGFLIIIFFFILGEITVLFHDYVFFRLGINRSLLMSILWLLPSTASYLVAYHSYGKYKLLNSLSFIIILPLIGSMVHYINGVLGVTRDFPGLDGAVTVFKIYFTIGSIAIMIGAFLGVYFSRIKSCR